MTEPLAVMEEHEKASEKDHTSMTAIIVVKRIGKMFSGKTGTPVASGEDRVIEEVWC